MSSTAIIGSGITALTRAWQLTKQGEDCTVFESSGQIGGAIQSHRSGDYLAEEGPNSIQVNSPAVDDFLRSIPGLEARMVEAEPAANKRYIVRGGKLHAVPMNPWQAVRTRLWSIGGRLRVLREPFIPAIDPDQEESAADFVRRRLGGELYEYAINPLIGGIYAGDPEQLSLRYAFPKLYALEQEHGGLIRGAIAKKRAARAEDQRPNFQKRILSFRDGLHELPRHLVDALGSRVVAHSQVDRIEYEPGRWTLTTGKTRQSFDQLMLTVPAHALGNLPLPEDLAEGLRFLQSIDYPPVSVLSLAFKRSEISHPLDGFGALVPERERRNILGVLFPSSIFHDRAPPGEVLLTAFVGGERSPELATSDTDRLEALVCEELRMLLGLRGDPTFRHHRHWPLAIPQYKIGYGRVLEAMQAVERDHPGLSLAGNYRTGISLTYCIEAGLSSE